MPTLNVIARDGRKHTIEGDVGDRVKNVIQKNIPVNDFGLCGGSCACGTCHVYVDASFIDRLPGPAENESEMLSIFDTVQSNSRLSCQIVFEADLDGLSVEIAPED